MPYHYPNALLGEAPAMGTFSTEKQDAPSTVIVRLPSTQLLNLNSADRTQNSVAGGQKAVSQPWNSFILQRPQNLMEAFATRITVSEVRFPWYVPNINTNNNRIWITAEANTMGNPLTTYLLTVPPGYYTGTTLASELNTQISLASPTLLRPPTVTFANSQFVITPGSGSGSIFSLYWFDPVANPTVPNKTAFQAQPSLSQTMGLEYAQVSGGSNTTQPLIGNPTEVLYTQYIDIVSEKLNYYSHIKDGSSSGTSNRALICRLYIADEVSIPETIAPGQAPFVIHRQFKNPKEIMWNKEAVIDYVDIAVLDQYGQLVPLPVIQGNQSSSPTVTVGSYPNFQITLLASEN